MKLRGPVQNIEEVEYSSTGKYTNKYSFMKSGDLSELSSFNPDGSLIRRLKYQFNPEGKKITLKCYVKNDSMSYILNFYYNNEAKICSTCLNQHGVYGKRSETIYNERSDILKETFFGMNSEIESQTDYIYSQGKLKEEKHYEKFQNRRWDQIYHYNKNNKTITYLNGEGKLMNRVSISSDEKSNVISEEVFNENNKLLKLTYYSYNKTGDYSEISIKDSSGTISKIHRYFYQYDHHSNWTLMIDSLNNEIEKMITRKIQYY